MATYQIIALRILGQSDGSFDVLGVFWLTPPPGTEIPLPNVKSSFVGISADDLVLLQLGSIVEIPFTSRDAKAFLSGHPSDPSKQISFPSGTSQDNVDQMLLAYFTELQERMNKLSPPLPGAASRAFDGSKWVTVSQAAQVSQAQVSAKLAGS